MQVKDKRFNDPFDPDDGLRVLITRLRPRGLSKAKETWHEWDRALAPSLPLLKAFKAKQIDWPAYRERFLREMQSEESQAALARLRAVVASGRPVTLLCSSACPDRERCHRSLVANLITGGKPSCE